MPEVVTYHTPDTPKNISALSTYLGARLMSKREFFASFLAAIFNGVVIYTIFFPTGSTQLGTPNISNVLAQVREEATEAGCYR